MDPPPKQLCDHQCQANNLRAILLQHLKLHQYNVMLYYQAEQATDPFAVRPVAEINTKPSLVQTNKQINIKSNLKSNRANKLTELTVNSQSEAGNKNLVTPEFENPF